MRRASSGLVLTALLALAACGPPDGSEHGTLIVRFTAKSFSVPDLTLSKATMRLRRIEPIGNVPPPGPPPMPPPELTFDALSPLALDRSFEGLRDGIYSRVLFSVENMQLEGSWRGTPFVARLAPFRGPMVDLRAITGQRLSAENDVIFAVVCDPGTWFAGNLLDAATASGGQILLDLDHNFTIAMMLGERIARSFAFE